MWNSKSSVVVACFLSGQAKDLSASLYLPNVQFWHLYMKFKSFIKGLKLHIQVITYHTFCPQNLCICMDLATNIDYFPIYYIKWLIFVTKTECVYCAVRTERLIIQVKLGFKIKFEVALACFPCSPFHLNLSELIPIL